MSFSVANVGLADDGQGWRWQITCETPKAQAPKLVQLGSEMTVRRVRIGHYNFVNLRWEFKTRILRCDFVFVF